MRFSSLKTTSKILSVLAFAMGALTLHAQNVGKNPISMINPVSPTTGALLKYIDFDMNSSTGVPDITIPLLEIKGKQLNVPISISYNASGIKVNEQAGNVGLCWSLSAGGIVSRAIRGKPDGDTYWPKVQNAHSDGFDPLASPGDFNLAKAISDRAIDGAPDIYSYNFGSYSGKFLDIYGKTPNIVMLPKKPLDIKRYPMGNHSRFEITAEDGTLYKFDSIEASVIKTSYGINETSYTAVLTQIRSADGSDVITFEYEDTKYQDHPALSESFTFIFNACSFGNEVRTGSLPDTYSNSTSQVKGKQLKRILFSEGSVEFQVSYDRQDVLDPVNTKSPKINRIILKDLAGAEIKTISFVYSYYNSSSSAPYAKRLRLDQVDVCPQSGLCGNPLFTNSYKFTYNATPLPFLNSFAQDHWGYYNGVNTNYTLLPTYPIRLTPATCYTTSPFCGCTTPVLSNSFSGAYRESSPDYVKAGVLEKIEYPTGGNVQFNFETNQAAPIVYYTPSAKNRYAQIVNNAANNGTLISASAPISDLIPSANPTLGNSVCAKVTLGYTYPAGTSPATLTQWKPYAEVYEYLNGDAGTLLTTINMNGSETSKVYNFNMKFGYSYILKIYTRLKNSTLTGNLDYSLPVLNTKLYYVGGLRLKQKTIYDPVSLTSSISTYAYSAATFKQPNYTQKTFGFSLSSNGCGEHCIGSPAGTNIYDVKEYTTLSASYGGIDNEVNYSEVTTLLGASGENGKTITHYTPYNNDYFWRKGNMDDQQFFNASGKLLKKVVNHYKTAPGSESIQGMEVNGTFEHPCLAGQPQNFSIYTKYANYKPTFNPSEWFYMDSTTTYEYDTQNSNVVSTKTIFSYQNPIHMQLSQSYTINSNGKQVGKLLRYPLDYTYNGTLIGNAVVMKELTNRHIYNEPIEEISTVTTTSPASVLTTEAVMNTFQLNNNQIVKDATFRVKCTSTNASIPAEALTNYTYLTIPNGVLAHDYRYEYENRYTRYDLNQNLLELKQRDNSYAFICPSNGDLWAKTTHANYTEIAYSSFDHENVANDFTNWNYNNANIFTDATPPPLRGTFNGTKCYKFPTATVDIISNRIALSGSQQFKVSFWGKAGIIRVTVFPPGSNLTTAGVPLTLRTGPTRMGWTYYEGYFTNASVVQVSGTGMMDELRLYPASARMETYIYKQGLGIISNCNENNQNTFWSYDEFQRLRLTTDQDGNILQKNEYKYQHIQN